MECVSSITDFLRSLVDFGSVLEHVAGNVTAGVAFIGFLVSLAICFFGFRIFHLWLFAIGAIIGVIITPILAHLFLHTSGESVNTLIIILGAVVCGFLAIGLFHLSIAVLGFAFGAAPTWVYLSNVWGDNCVTIALTIIAGIIMAVGFALAFRVLYIIISSLIGGFSAATYLTYLVALTFGSGYKVDLPLYDTGYSNSFGCWVIFYFVIGFLLFISGCAFQFKDMIKEKKPVAEPPAPAPQAEEPTQQQPMPESSDNEPIMYAPDEDDEPHQPS